MAGIPALPLPPSLARTALIGLRGSLGLGWLAPQKMAQVFGLESIDTFETILVSDAGAPFGLQGQARTDALEIGRAHV